MLAGIYSSRLGRERAAFERRLSAAFPGASLELEGPLGVVHTGPPKPGSRRPRCGIAGSVYNTDELARELGVSAGADAAELIATGYALWGQGVLERVRGGFALVVWDESAERVLVAQDQVGIGTMFVHRNGGELWFASEIRDLLRLFPRAPGPDSVAVAHWLAMANLYDDRTLYEGIGRIGAGSAMTCHRGDIRSHRYWAPQYQPPFEGSRLEIATRLRDSLVRSVDIRTRDVERVGITLSGGFDSSAVAAAVCSCRPATRAPVRGYSAVFSTDPEMDDRDLLDALEEALPVQNVRLDLWAGGALSVSLRHLREWKVPLAGAGGLTEHSLMVRAGGDGVSVMLDGQGGDELFGFSPFLLADRIRTGRIASAVQLARPNNRVPWLGTARILKAYGLKAAIPYRGYAWYRKLRGPADPPPGFLKARVARSVAEAADDLRWARVRTGPRWWAHLATMLTDDREASGIGDYLRHRSIPHGIEARPPLYDVELIETALMVPPEFAFDPYLNRPLAREAMAGLLPDAVRLSRRKSNLAPFYHRAAAGPDLRVHRELLGARRLEIEAWVDPEAIRAMLDHAPGPDEPGTGEWLTGLWACVTAECWLRSLSDDDFVDRSLANPRLAEPRQTELKQAHPRLEVA